MKERDGGVSRIWTVERRREKASVLRGEWDIVHLRVFDKSNAKKSRDRMTPQVDVGRVATIF